VCSSDLTFLVTDAISGPSGTGILRLHSVAIRSISNVYSISRLVADPRVTPLGAGPRPVPAVEQPLGHFLRGEREDEMVPPCSVDVQISRTQPLLAESEFLHDPPAGPVLRANADLDPVQSHGTETVVHRQRHRRR